MECKTIRSGLIDVCFTVSVSISVASICHACLICVHVEVKIYCNTSGKMLSFMSFRSCHCHLDLKYDQFITK